MHRRPQLARMAHHQPAVTWQQQSRRRSQLPPNWTALRATVRARAGARCEHVNPNGQRCTTTGNQCDHITRGNNHNLDNLQWLCHAHHAAKTALEGATAKPNRHRPAEPHPGIKA